MADQDDMPTDMQGLQDMFAGWQQEAQQNGEDFKGVMEKYDRNEIPINGFYKDGRPSDMG